MARFHNYSFGNVMLIARQKPQATHVAGILKKGEKGILILAPMIGRKKASVPGAAWRKPTYWPCGVRCRGGVNLVLAFVRNLRTWRAMARKKAQVDAPRG